MAQNKCDNDNCQETPLVEELNRRLWIVPMCKAMEEYLTTDCLGARMSV